MDASTELPMGPYIGRLPRELRNMIWITLLADDVRLAMSIDHTISKAPYLSLGLINLYNEKQLEMLEAYRNMSLVSSQAHSECSSVFWERVTVTVGCVTSTRDAPEYALLGSRVSEGMMRRYRRSQLHHMGDD